MNKHQMMQLMAQRLNFSPEELQAMQGGNFFAVAQRRFANDPMALSMLQMMQERSQTSVVEEPVAPAASRRRRPVDDDVEELEEALRAANLTLRYLAQLLGACRCWGRNPACPRCGGDGKPGSSPSSHPQRFLEWVTPGLRALGYELVPAEKPGSATKSSPDHLKEERS